MDRSFKCRLPDRNVEFPFETIIRIRCRSGWVWARVEISSTRESVNLSGLTNGRARQLAKILRQHVVDALLLMFEPHGEELSLLWQSYENFLKTPRFLSHSDLGIWRRSQSPTSRQWAQEVGGLLDHAFFEHHDASDSQIEKARILLAALQGDSGTLETRNEEFVQQEVIAHKDFFDAVETTPLTDEQRRAAVVTEDRNLLVASAGSGKTSTVVGKVGYALLRELASPDEILVVVFNTHAAREIESRVHVRLGSHFTHPPKIKVKTFHALGLEIIADVAGTRPRVAGDGDVGMAALIDNLLANDAEFARMWAQFHALYPTEAKDPGEFKTPEDWYAHLRETGVRADGHDGFRTLRGELTNTEGECAIANWLFMNGMNYSPSHRFDFRAWNGRTRQCSPAFYLPNIDVVVEHIALDANGRPPAAFAGSYRDFQAWKRTLSDDKGPAVIETCFAEYASGVLFENLECELKNRGAVLRPISARAVLEKIPDTQLTEMTELLETFARHARSNRLTPGELKAAAGMQPNPARALLFAHIADRLVSRYEARLRASGVIDFEEMVLAAARHAREGRYRHNFRLILVDEFQDISRARAELLLGLLKQAPECKLFAVGDDWQSIYRFAGSDIGLFTGFASRFGKTAVNYLTRTFRSNQGIAEVAAHFVQQNPAQMQKGVTAEDPTRKGTIVIRWVGRRRDEARHVVACLEEIEASADGQRTVYILGRHRRQVPDALTDWEVHYRERLRIEYMTIHASKGLQADHVIVLGLQSGSFPSERADDRLLHLAMPAPEAYLYAEERRLFYVAITRARHTVYLLGSKRSPSCFLTELIHSNPSFAPMLRVVDEAPVREQSGRPSGLRHHTPAGPKPEPCPRCGVGMLDLRTGRYGSFYGCSEFPACRHTTGAADV